MDEAFRAVKVRPDCSGAQQGMSRGRGHVRARGSSCLHARPPCTTHTAPCGCTRAQSIKNPAIWENMAHLCIKNKRLDVAGRVALRAGCCMRPCCCALLVHSLSTR